MPSRDFSHLDALANSLQEWAVEEARTAVERGKDAAKARVPVDTGALKVSITTEDTPDGATVHAQSTEGGAKREYAFYVEYGTRHTPAQPFMTPAIPAVEGALDQGAQHLKRKVEGMQE